MVRQVRMERLLVMAKRVCIGQGPMSLEQLQAFLEKSKVTAAFRNFKQPNHVVTLIV